MNLTEALNWRYAVKKYTDEKVSEDKIEEILKATLLTASSVGIQPYRIINISNKDIREKLAENSFNKQINEASHLFAFAAFETITKSQIHDLISLMASERQLPEATFEDYKVNLENYLLARTDEENFTWATKQAYIALGTALVAAADLKVDTTPMEGFDASLLDELLNLKEQGLKSVVLLSLGYRDSENDFLANQKKVRLPLEEFVINVN